MMKHIVLTALLGTALTLSSTAASATDTSAQLGISTPVVNTNTQVHTQTSTHTQADSADYYRRNTVTEEEQRYGENDIRTRTQYNTHLRAAPQDINPAAGIRENIPPSARVMGRIQGGMSYND